MAFPNQFLDELRMRVSLEDVVGRHVKLIRRGREYVGLSPFKSEKTPSFTVVPEKGFYHCFSTGEHGDVIGFVMKMEGLTFPEAVERLAADAGLEVPRQTPQQRETERRRASLLEVTEAACAWFESQLKAPAGRAALAYLRGRGLDDATIALFRLGFAPDSRSAIKTALMSDHMPEAMLVEAGLLRKPDDGGTSFDYFRGRVIFPITDRRDRVIGFGGRVLGDGQPKYLNSPDTPLFNKGRVLYGHALARRAAHDSGRIVVTEGYTDVIALSRAGFADAVAPLGTALTESQMEELWRMAPEPILCFDGDEAGNRAAGRAAERALPMLAPDRSLRFVTLPQGEDPDSLLTARGPGAMAELLDGARSLDEKLWEIETAGRRIDTPERIAGLETRLERHAYAIADGKVQYQYLQSFRRRLRERFSGPARNAGRGAGRGSGYAKGRGGNSGFRGGNRGQNWGNGPRGGAALGETPLARPGGAELFLHRQMQVLIATVIGHPWLLETEGERFGSVNLSDPHLGQIRQHILSAFTGNPDLDSEGLKRHLRDAGLSDGLDALLGPEVYVHAGFARSDSPHDAARIGFEQMLLLLSRKARDADLAEAERLFTGDPSQENWARLENLKTESQDEQDGQGVLSADMRDDQVAHGTADAMHGLPINGLPIRGT